MQTTTLRERGQLTLPAEVREALRIDSGALLAIEVVEGRIVMTPKTLIDSDQAWFWTDRWQAMEREVDAEVAAGRTTVVDGVDELFDALDD